MEVAAFISLIIVAVTQMVKMAAPGVQAWVTILVALCVGILVALLDTLVGLPNISVVEGLQFALTAVGITTVASKAGGGTKGD